MSVFPIITIIIGFFVAVALPEWVKFGDKSTRQFVRLVFRIIGIMIAISGFINLFRD